MKTRQELAQYLFCGTGVELGVAAGGFSNEILKLNPPREGCRKFLEGKSFEELSLSEQSRALLLNGTALTSIDRWSDPHHSIVEYAAALKLLSPYGSRSRVIRASFSEALVLFEPDSLDFVYVDGYAHTGQEGGKTLEDWWPKIRPGGVMAGHDYDPLFQPTIAAVDAFVARHGLELRLTEEEKLRSWWVVKKI